MHISAIVVTYNRKALLQECIGALLCQTLVPTQIIVVDNSSTDGTAEWLAAQQGLEIITQPNQGAAGGVSSGIRKAHASGADWVWIMDDDTIPQPDALAKLVQAIATIRSTGDPFGYFVSKALWNDGSPHLMNLPFANAGFKGKQSQEWYRQKGILPIINATFVSLLISREAYEKAGLPVTEMFIWADDQEYTWRLHRAGFAGGLVEDSVVWHKTPSNYRSDLFVDAPGNIWKYRYGLRNELYIRRNYKSYSSFLRNAAKRFFLYPFLIVAKRKDARWPFIRVVWQSTWDALRFNPKPPYLQDTGS